MGQGQNETDRQDELKTLQMSTVLGIDLYHGNALPASSGFHDLYNAGIRFLFHKLTDGDSYTDPTFAPRMQRLETMQDASGQPLILSGAYHFARTGNGVYQADRFLEAASDFPDLALALDWELPDDRKDPMDRPNAEAFVTRVHAKTGKFTLLYASRAFPGEHGIGRGYTGPLAQCPFWLSAPGVKVPKPPAPWSRVAIHQYDWEGRIAGMTGVDLDVFQGTEAELRTFWAVHSVAV